jgi:hypothetical protein
MPYRAEIVAQAQQTLTLSLTEGLVIALQRRQLGFDLLDALQGRVPTLFSFTRHQAVCGLREVVLSLGTLGLVTRFFQCPLSRLALCVLLGEDALQRRQCRSHPCRLQRLEHRLFNRSVDPQPTDSQTRRGAAIHAATATDVTGHATRCAAIGPIECATATAAAQHTTE